jgi:hypothetical protein
MAFTANDAPRPKAIVIHHAVAQIMLKPLLKPLCEALWQRKIVILPLFTFHELGKISLLN